MKISYLQKGLWQWFALAPTDYRSFDAVNSVCKQIYSQYFPNKSVNNARYHLLYPLLRYGVVEFYGENRLALSPTAVLQGDLNILFLHAPGIESAPIQETPLYSLPGLAVYSKTREVFSLVEHLGFPLSTFSLSESLCRFPSLDMVIEGWPEITVLELEHFYYFTNNNTWKLTRPERKGIYKRSTEPYIRKMLRFGSNQWKLVPLPEQHIDAFSICWLWSQLQNELTIEVSYSLISQSLTVHTPFFPLLIERLLFINTLLNGKNNIDPAKRQYFLTKEQFKILNQLFHNRISVI